MKKNILVILLTLIIAACSSTPSKTVFVDTENICKVILDEEQSYIAFKSVDEKKLAIDIFLQEGKKVRKLLLYDGENLIRTGARNGRLHLKGRELALFKNMVMEGKTIDIRGRIDTYNYFCRKLTADDVEVISRIFSEDQI